MIKAVEPARIDLKTERGRLFFAQQLWERFCEELMADPNKAYTRLVAGIQIGLRDARQGGFTDGLFAEIQRDEGEEARSDKDAGSDNVDRIGIGTIGNEYGYLAVRKHAGQPQWVIADTNGEDWEDISQALYDELVKFECERTVKEDNDGA